MAKRKRILIHSGPGKTGTSAIQNWFNSHRDELLSKGVYYPKHRADPNGISSGHKSLIFDGENLGEVQVNADKVNQLMRDFDASACNTLLLSSEFFFRQLPSMAGHFPDAQFLLYLRSPLDQLQSGYIQSVKRHGRFSAFERRIVKNYPMLNTLSDVIGQVGHGRVDVRPYHAELFYQGSIVNDVLKWAQIDLREQTNKVVNKAYAVEALELRRRLNRYELGEHGIQLDFVLQKYSEEHWREYSFLDHHEQIASRDYLINALTTFVEKNCLQNLMPLIAVLEKAPAKPFFDQSKNVVDFEDLLGFIRVENAKLLDKIRKKVERQATKTGGDPKLLTLLGIDAQNQSNVFNTDYLSQVHQKLQSTALSPSDYYFELAKYLRDLGQLEAAIAMLDAAKSLQPDRNDTNRLQRRLQSEVRRAAQLSKQTRTEAQGDVIDRLVRRLKTSISTLATKR